MLGGQFITIGRDQHRHNYQIQGNLVQHLTHEQEWTIWSEYKKITTCQIRLKRRIAETFEVKRDFEEGWSHLDATRTINIASVHGEDKDSEFLYVVYKGHDAVEVFQRDFEQFATVKDIECLELYGYNRRPDLPGLVFYDAPVPLACAFEANKFSPLLRTYIEYQFKAAPIANNMLDVGEMWIDPRTGAFRRGPYVRYGSPLPQIAYGFADTTTVDGIKFLSLDTYKDSSAIFDYLKQNISSHNILRGICLSSTGTLVQVTDERDVAFILSSLPGTIYNKTRLEIAVRWPRDAKEWQYALKYQTGMESMWESKVIMGDGSLRLTVTSAGIQHLRKHGFNLYYGVRGDWIRLADSWLSQAHSIFNQLRIHKDEWKEYAILGGFKLYLHCDPPGSADAIPTNEPVYLFIRPIPRPSDQQTIWSSWVKGAKYFWSLDPSGHEETSGNLQALPTFNVKLHVWHQWWSNSAYDPIQHLHDFAKVDPVTPSLTESLNLTALEVVGDEARFEEIQDNQPDVAPVPIVQVNVSTKSGDDGHSTARRRNIRATETSNAPVEVKFANKDHTHSRESSMAVRDNKATQKTISGAMADLIVKLFLTKWHALLIGLLLAFTMGIWFIGAFPSLFITPSTPPTIQLGPQ
ncbi:hypothetical protein WG66_010852 [Moniliophthora roreri]|nr:hypothetical protein WG66_010852 [Moniliophthora roreri]